MHKKEQFTKFVNQDGAWCRRDDVTILMVECADTRGCLPPRLKLETCHGTSVMLLYTRWLRASAQENCEPDCELTVNTVGRNARTCLALPKMSWCPPHSIQWGTQGCCQTLPSFSNLSSLTTVAPTRLNLLCPNYDSCWRLEPLQQLRLWPSHPPRQIYRDGIHCSLVSKGFIKEQACSILSPQYKLQLPLPTLYSRTYVTTWLPRQR